MVLRDLLDDGHSCQLPDRILRRVGTRDATVGDRRAVSQDVVRVGLVHRRRRLDREHRDNDGFHHRRAHCSTDENLEVAQSNAVRQIDEAVAAHDRPRELHRAKCLFQGDRHGDRCYVCCPHRGVCLVRFGQKRGRRLADVRRLRRRDEQAVLVSGVCALGYRAAQRSNRHAREAERDRAWFHLRHWHPHGRHRQGPLHERTHENSAGTRRAAFGGGAAPPPRERVSRRQPGLSAARRERQAVLEGLSGSRQGAQEGNGNPVHTPWAHASRAFVRSPLAVALEAFPVQQHQRRKPGDVPVYLPQRLVPDLGRLQRRRVRQGRRLQPHVVHRQGRPCLRGALRHDRKACVGALEQGLDGQRRGGAVAWRLGVGAGGLGAVAEQRKARC
mmetsp:Transcript_48306/g.134917  ORF Transcript_48306/g.134917 Transcript_48306/m.134917 type:complete len:387 (+) Transcript_48306:607-1767(+)